MYTYHLLINKTASGKKLFFKYGNTKNISLQVGKQCAGIEKQFPKDYRSLLSQDKCFLLNMLKEGMKRAALVHILKTHEPLRVYKVTLSISDNKGLIEERDLTAKLKLYSMITERLKRPIDSSWKESEVLQRILNYQKSKETLSREVSSLYAYLYSKTKNYETERFSYLWMAMNGMYAALYPMASSNDREQMIKLLERFSLGTSMHTRNSRKSSGILAMLALKDVKEPVTKDSIINGEHKEILDKAEKVLFDDKGNRIDISHYGYFITDFAYYLRCHMFHTNTPVQLFCFYDDMELKAIRIVNGLLEEFLDQNLICLFRTVQS